MRDLFRTMFLLDNYTEPENKTDVFLYVLLYAFWIPFVLIVTFIVLPLYLLLTPFRLIYRKLEEDAINEYTGKW